MKVEEKTGMKGENDGMKAGKQEGMVGRSDEGRNGGNGKKRAEKQEGL
jgi:hypothetical protein